MGAMYFAALLISRNAHRTAPKVTSVPLIVPWRNILCQTECFSIRTSVKEREKIPCNKNSHGSALKLMTKVRSTFSIFRILYAPDGFLLDQMTPAGNTLRSVKTEN